VGSIVNNTSFSVKVVLRPVQQRFLDIPQSPLCYWLREKFFDLLSGKTLGNVASVVQGLATADDSRFVRHTWETPLAEWVQEARNRRWVPFEKGGGYGRWFGHHWWTVDWQHSGSRIKATPNPRVQNEQYYFREGWTYTTTARGSIGLRILEGKSIFAHKSSAVIATSDKFDAYILNSRVPSYIVRGLRAQIDLSEDYVSRTPIPHTVNSGVIMQDSCIFLKSVLVSSEITERSFDPHAFSQNPADLDSEAIAAVLPTVEGYSEKLVFDAYGLDADDTAAVIDETGTPAGWFPLLAGFEQIPPVPEGLPAIPPEVVDHLGHHKRLTLADKELADVRSRLRSLYDAGPGGSLEEEETAGNDNGKDEERVSVGARIPMPPETFLEELSQKLEIHPISVYWLLKEGVEREGWRCLPEERRLACDRVTVMVLRLLGHQWPTQIETGEAVPDWADADGIIPLTGGTGEPTLIERLRVRIAEEYDKDEGSFERHFAEISGKPLEQWIETEFFKYQLSLLRKRPLAWQIQSGKYARKRKPAFACLVYFHKLDGDLLPKIRAQYVGPLRRKWETELRSIEEVPDRSRSDRQDARRVELEEMIAELKDFDERLKKVMEKGFASGLLKELIAKERPDKWCSIDGELAPPADTDALLLQEGRYLPDVNDGVRVNIAPLQKAGLLAAEVIAKKDLETAIADRAEWRSDERRWCREGKLPHPGWWKQGAANGS